MASTIALASIIPRLHYRFRQRYTAIMESMIAEIESVIKTYTRQPTFVPSQFLQRINTQVDQIVMRKFVGADMRNAFSSDLYSPLSPYADALNEHLVLASIMTVKGYNRYFRNKLPDDLYQQLQVTSNIAISEGIRFSLSPTELFSSSHTWVDPSGLTLNDRIWKSGMFMRERVAEIVSRGIRDGQSARDIARQLERFVIPDANIRTRTPYNRDASFPAMRLARTEIARAAAQTNLIAARTNPFVDSMDIARSGNGDPKCPDCPRHETINISGVRVRAPYPLESVPALPIHPHCKCHYRPFIKDTAKDMDRIRQEIDAILPNTPLINITTPLEFLQTLLGAVLSRLYLNNLYTEDNV